MSLQESIKSIFFTFITAGARGKYSSDSVRNIILTTLFSCVALFFVLLFGIDSLSNDKYPHGLILLTLSMLIIFNYLYLYRSGNYHFSSNFVVYLMGVFCIYLLCTGGIGNTGPLWYYVFPLLAFYIQGSKKGMLTLLVVIFISAIILFVPKISIAYAYYSMTFKTRFMGSFTAVAIMSFIYEYTRQKAQDEMTELSEKLDNLSRIDELTGIANRRDMKERLKQEKSRCKRNGGQFSLVICDIDHFKNINDNYGHDCGDNVLQSIAEILKGILRDQDIVSRWGGEEFLILLPQTDLVESWKVAERIRQAVEKKVFQYDNDSFSVTMSFGVQLSDDTCSIEDFIKRADRCLYRAKESGKNRVVSEV